MKFQMKLVFLLMVAVICVQQSACEKEKYVKATPKGDYYFVETFESNTIGSEWVKSNAKKDGVDDEIAKYDGEWSIESSLDAVLEGDLGLVLKSKAKHHAISAKLNKPYKFSEKKPLVIQYEVKFQNALECGGAYVKLLEDEPNLSLENFYDKSSYSVMFGPDKCGTEKKFHFIVRYKNPVKGTYEEKHAKKSELMDAFYSDGKTHLYTLVVKPDDTFKMMIDLNEVNSGSLLKDMEPSIVPPKEIVDPDDKMPENWDDREEIQDTEAVKPDDWDENEPKQIVDAEATMPEGWLENEPELIPDPTAVQPEDWDESTDGIWEAPKIDNEKCQKGPGCGKWTAPLIDNPKYKGKWRAPMISNPKYQGKWEPRKIANPEYFEETNPFKSLTSFSSIGLELWSMTDNIYFDNFLITDDEKVATDFAKETWEVKHNLELVKAESVKAAEAKPEETEDADEVNSEDAEESESFKHEKDEF
jgi:calnexin